VNLTVIAGIVDGISLQSWLYSEPTKERLTQADNIHALIEYVHRYNFADFDRLFADLNSKQIAEYGLKGRIFWEKGQIEWRRLYEGEFSLLILIEDGIWDEFPEAFKPAQDFDEDIDSFKDRNLMLWGTYNDKEKAYYELRVAGSKPIEYPDAIIKLQKKYPVLKIREYFNKQKEPVLWRFLFPEAKDTEELKLKGKTVED